jgi:hypothetical protein
MANAQFHSYLWRQVNRVRQQAGSYGFLPDPNDVFETAMHCCGQRACVCVCVPDAQPAAGAGLLANALEQH